MRVLSTEYYRDSVGRSVYFTKYHGSLEYIQLKGRDR